MHELLNFLLSGLNYMGIWFGPYAFAMLIQSSILIVLLLGLDLLLRKHTRAVFRYCMWLLVLVKLILPPGLTSPASIGYWAGDLWAVETQNREPAAAADPVVSEEDFATLDSGGLAAAPEEAITAPESALLPAIAETAAPPAEDEARVAIGWQGLVMLGWLFGLFVFGALLLQRVWFVKGLLRQAQDADSRLGEILKGGCDKLGLRGDRIKVKISATMVSPAVCGLIRPTILLPGYLAEKFNPSQLHAVMLHELAHIKRGDLWVNLIQTILQIGYFYHPLLWVANRMIRRVREQAVDEMVLVALEKNATDYSHTLIDIAEMAFHKPSLGLRFIGVVESKKALSQRIKHIISRPIPRTAKLGLAGLLVVFVIAMVLLPMARAKDSEQKLPYATCDTAYSFNGVTDFMEVPTNDLLDINEAFTAETWINVHQGTGEDAIFSKEIPWKSGWTLIVNSLRANERERTDVLKGPFYGIYSLTLAIGDGNRFYNMTSLPCIEKDTWHHVAAIWNQGKATIYVDGKFICSQMFPKATAAAVPLRIGKGSADLGRYFNGKLADIRIWNTALDEETICKNMKQRLTGTETALTACWILPPDSHHTVHDISPSGNDASFGSLSAVSKNNSEKTDSMPFSATLPNGVTVELVCLFKGDSKENATWWRPDGTVMNREEYQPYEDRFKLPEGGEENTQFLYGIIAKFTPFHDVVADVFIKKGLPIIPILIEKTCFFYSKRLKVR